ncbi:MAG: hypothetical protein KKE50_01400 [Nanoarchaeota archaeon]|nr:hypothetical protein [Nanoarchaeota archaeon]
MIILGLLRAKESEFEIGCYHPCVPHLLEHSDGHISIDIPEAHQQNKDETIKDIIHELLHAGCRANQRHFCNIPIGEIKTEVITSGEYSQQGWNPCSHCGEESRLEELTQFIFLNSKMTVRYIAEKYKIK